MGQLEEQRQQHRRLGAQSNVLPLLKSNPPRVLTYTVLVLELRVRMAELEGPKQALGFI